MEAEIANLRKELSSAKARNNPSTLSLQSQDHMMLEPQSKNASILSQKSDLNKSLSYSRLNLNCNVQEPPFEPNETYIQNTQLYYVLLDTNYA